MHLQASYVLVHVVKKKKKNTNKTPKNNSMEIAFIIDKSGSMYHLTKSTIKNFNSLIKKHKKRNQNITTSVILFNHETKVLYNHLPINEIPTMTDKDYQADGCTALLDAVGGAIHHIGNVHKYAREEDRPEKTLFIITTDGMENASKQFSGRELRALVEKKKEEGWEFIFLGANIDAVETASDYGIKPERAANFPDHPPQKLKLIVLEEKHRLFQPVFFFAVFQKSERTVPG